MAFRNILRNRRRSILTILIMSAGFILVSISLGLVEGSYGDIIELFTARETGHVQIANKSYIENPSLYKTITNYEDKISNLKKNPQIRAIAPRVFAGALAFNKNKTLGVEVLGIDPILESAATKYSERISEGQDFSPNESYEVIIGKKVSKILELKLGQELVLISQGADGSIANDIFKVKAIIGEEGDGKDDYRVYMSMMTASEFYTLYNQVHEISIHLHDITDAKKFSGSIKLEDGLQARPWQEIEADFYRAMELDKKGNNVTLFILLLMVGVSVLNTVLMSTLERTREFGVLKALGTLPKNLFSLILLEGLLLAVMSALIGAAISIVVNYYWSVNGIRLAEPISFAGMKFYEYRSALTFSAIFYPAIVVFITSGIASLYPALKSSRITIAQALREF